MKNLVACHDLWNINHGGFLWLDADFISSKRKNELTAIWLNPHLPNFEKISGKIEVALEFKRSHESCDMMWVTSREILYEDFIFDADGPSEMEVSRPDCKILLFKFFLG